MKKISFVIPIYNDWESVIKLLDNINIILKEFDKEKFYFECLLINDASKIKMSDFKLPEQFKKLTLINIKKNQGHARCIAFGIRHLSYKSEIDYGIIMDGDGEDRPEEVKLLIQKAIENVNFSVVAKRVKRSEGIFFKISYEIHKILTYLFTGKKINFGNFCCLTKNDIKKLSDKGSLWNSFSGTLKKYLLNCKTIDSIRGSRYFGPSKMSILKLLLHSMSIIPIFRNSVIFRSILLLIVSLYFTLKINGAFILFQIFLLIFNALIYFISLRSDKDSLFNSKRNVESTKIYTQ